MQQRIEQEKIVSQISQQIRQSLNLEEVLQTTVTQVRQFLQTDRVIIFQLQLGGGGTAIVESVGEEWQSLLSVNFFADRYIDNYRQEIISAKIGIYNAGVDECDVEQLEKFQVKACLVAPLFQGEMLWGLLIAHHCSMPRQWQELEINLVKQLSTQIGIAIEQSELYQKVQSELAQRRQVEAELKESAAGLRLALESAQMGTWDWNILTGQIVWSANMEALFGLQPREFDGSYAMFVSRLHPEDRDRVLHAIEQSVATDAEYDIEFRVVYPNGYIRWAQSKGQVFYKDGQPVRMAGVDLDITASQQLRAEKEVLLLQEKAAREQAEDANRSKDEFLAVVSHELRSPLNAILGWARLLRTRELDKQTTNRALETIERNTQTQVQLIEDLLDVSRMIRGDLQLTMAPVSLATLIEDTVTSMSLAAEAKQIQLCSTLNTNCQVLGDNSRLQQIITNLVTNAIKFTPKGGSIEISLQKNGSQAQIEVTDTGKGISQEFLPHIFDRFRRADSSTTRSTDGLGLGLAIVSHLTRLHNGAVSASSPGVGQGATFTVMLPVFESISNDFDSAITPEVAPKLPLTNIRILLVDDEVDSLELVELALAASGAIIEAVSCAADAIKVIEQFKPDILISDIAVPQPDSYTLLSSIREMKQVGQIPAIALTACGKEDIKKSLHAGFQRHLTKPVEPTQLIQAILVVLVGVEAVPSR